MHGAGKHGPYVPEDGGSLEFTIFVKAAPERSKKYGETVCTAGILDDGRLIRLYPVKWDVYRNRRFPKWKRVAARLIPSDEPAKRPESHKLLAPFEPIRSPLRRVGGKTPWQERMDLVRKGVDPRGVQGLRDAQANHGTSLGIVRVKELVDFRITSPLEEIVEQADYRVSEQKTLTGAPIMEGSRIDKVKHVFRYRWRCFGACCDSERGTGNPHDTTCEDWELFQSFRQWRKKYPDDVEFLRAFKNRYYDCMGQTDLYFALGTPSDPRFQRSWMIVGLIYPFIKQRPDPRRSSLCLREYSPSELLQISAKLDRVPESSGEGFVGTERGGPLDSFL